MNWHPIETAPKDGKWILLSGGLVTDGYYDEKRPAVAHWVQRFIDDDGKVWEEDPDCDKWGVAYWDGAWYTEYRGATHWMPIEELKDG